MDNLGQVICMVSFWFSYPSSKRGSKKEFTVQWGKIITPDTDLMLVYDSLQKYIAYKRWCESRGKWLASLPHACRYIKNERWWDDVPDKRETNKTAHRANESQPEHIEYASEEFVENALKEFRERGKREYH